MPGQREQLAAAQPGRRRDRRTPRPAARLPGSTSSPAARSQRAARRCLARGTARSPNSPRCSLTAAQENLLAQLKTGVRALHAPLNTLNANWAYMVIVAIAWSLKAWFALTIPVTPRWRTQHEADRERVLRMEFRSFVQRFILIPTQILQTGRQLVYRLLAWRPDLSIFFRLLDAL
jgi:hypothetical protein